MAVSAIGVWTLVCHIMRCICWISAGLNHRLSNAKSEGFLIYGREVIQSDCKWKRELELLARVGDIIWVCNNKIGFLTLPNEKYKCKSSCYVLERGSYILWYWSHAVDVDINNNYTARILKIQSIIHATIYPSTHLFQTIICITFPRECWPMNHISTYVAIVVRRKRTKLLHHT